MCEIGTTPCSFNNIKTNDVAAIDRYERKSEVLTVQVKNLNFLVNRWNYCMCL